MLMRDLLPDVLESAQRRRTSRTWFASSAATTTSSSIWPCRACKLTWMRLATSRGRRSWWRWRATAQISASSRRHRRRLVHRPGPAARWTFSRQLGPADANPTSATRPSPRRPAWAASRWQRRRHRPVRRRRGARRARGHPAHVRDHRRRAPEYSIPVLDFRGSPTGIDVTKVVRTQILPQINTGMAGRWPGGEVGAGLVTPPAEFPEALAALAARVPRGAGRRTERRADAAAVAPPPGCGQVLRSVDDTTSAGRSRESRGPRSSGVEAPRRPSSPPADSPNGSARKKERKKREGEEERERRDRIGERSKPDVSAPCAPGTMFDAPLRYQPIAGLISVAASSGRPTSVITTARSGFRQPARRAPTRPCRNQHRCSRLPWPRRRRRHPTAPRPALRHSRRRVA